MENVAKLSGQRSFM